MGLTFLPGRAKGEMLQARRKAREPVRTTAGMPVRLLEAEASERTSTGRSSGLRLMAASGQPSRAWRPVACRPAAWPITAAAPQRIRTVFPIVLRCGCREGTCQAVLHCSGAHAFGQPVDGDRAVAGRWFVSLIHTGGSWNEM